MNRFGRRGWILAGFFCGAVSLVLAGAARAEPLRWEDCVQRAARHNPELRSAERAWDASRATWRGSVNGVLPGVTLANSYSRTHVGSHDGRDSDGHSWQTQLGASLDIFNLADWANIQSASAGVDVAQADRDQSAAAVLLSLRRSFAGLLYAQEQVQVAASIRDLWRTDAAMIGLRYDSGVESKGNKMNTEAQFLQAEADVAQAARDLRVAQQDLGRSLGEEGFQALAVTGEWVVASDASDVADIEAGVDQTPRVRAQRSVLDQARAARLNARASFWPTLAVTYNRGFSGPSEFSRENSYWNLGGNLSLPLFAGGPTAAYERSRAADFNLEKAGEDLRSLRHQVRTEWESALSARDQALDQVRVQRAFLDAARQRRREADVRYQNGLMTFEEWQIVVVSLVNFEKSYLKSEQNALTADAQWRFVRGVGLEGL